MKIRTDFVTNSSSSSFVISKEYLDPIQIIMIHEHIAIAKELIEDARNKHEKLPDFGYVEDVEKWNISETKNIVAGYTSMDNFDMHSFLAAIGVLPGTVHWSDGYHDLETKYDIDDWHDEEAINEKWREFKRLIKSMEEKKSENQN